MYDSTFTRTDRHLPESLKITKPLPDKPKPRSFRYANLHYIRAAIYQATGIELTIKKTAQYLVEEGLLTEKQARSLVFDNYDSLYVTTINHIPKSENPKPVDQQPLVMKEYEEDSEIELDV